MAVTITVPDLAEQTHVSCDTLYAYAARDEDPIPLLYLKGSMKNGFFIVSDLEEWLRRNTNHYKDRKKS